MIADSQTPYLILASRSPRRKYLLEQAGLSFTVITSDVDESVFECRDPESFVRTLAEAKASAVAKDYPASWVIGADTIVLIDGAVLGKPESAEEARKMLARLSGQSHHVYTGFSIQCAERRKRFTDAVKTEVRFKRLTPEEIEWYVHTREPFDKAGAYAIQGLGTFLVKGISGSYTNVVGLPVCEVIETLIREEILGRRIGNGRDDDSDYEHIGSGDFPL